MLLLVFNVFFFMQKTEYEMRFSDLSSAVCPSNLRGVGRIVVTVEAREREPARPVGKDARADRVMDLLIGIGGALAQRVGSDRAPVERDGAGVRRQEPDYPTRPIRPL